LCTSTKAGEEKNIESKERSSYEGQTGWLQGQIIIEDLNVNYRIELVGRSVKRNSVGKFY
jgi:hypothetical protein